MKLARLLARGLVRLAGTLVPASYHDRFVEEWDAELWYATVCPTALVRRSLGTFQDALATRRLAPSPRHGGNMMFWQDVRFAFRSFAKRPLWTAVVLATLAVGIGANTAIFSLVHTVLVRPLSYPDSGALVKIVGRNLDTGEFRNLSPADFYDLQAQTETLASMGAHGWVGFFTVTGDGEPERVSGSNVTAGFFRTLGVTPRLGRLFIPEDDVEDAPPTVLLTHAFWQRRYGGRTSIVGEVIEVNAVAHDVIGVLPEGYRHPEPHPEREPALYSLYQFERAGAHRDGRFIRAIGRLRPGSSVEAAEVELVGIATRLEEEYPESNTARGVSVAPLKKAIVRDARAGLVVLFGAVVAVLLIACANIANLQLAEGHARRHELGIKAALGAGRGRLVRQLVTESFVLALIGGAFGFLLAYGAQGLLAARAIPRAEEMSFGLPVFFFTLALSSLTAVIFGLLPAWTISSGNLQHVIADSGTKATSRRSYRHILVACEVALSLVLLVSAGLFLKSLSELRGVAPGFEPERVLTMQLSLPTARYEEGEQIPFYDALYERIAALPDVTAVGATNILPLGGNYSTDGFQIEDRPQVIGEGTAAEARSVSPDYFDVMGIPLLRGRLFDARDDFDAPGVVVISQSMAEKFWPGEDPLGRRITYNRGVPEEGQREVGGTGSREIVGIVGDVKHYGLADGDVPMFYTPQPHYPSYHTMTLVIRSRATADTIASGVRRELSALDENVPVYAVRSLDAVLDASVTEPRFRTMLLGLFASFALALALIGVYAVMGLAISQRTAEIGIRMALGARGLDVVRMLVSQSMKPVLWGLALGLGGAVLVARWLESLLYNVTATDPATYLTVAALLAATALAAAFLPTLSATKIDPVVALRTEH